MSNTATPKDICGLTQAVAGPLERTPLRRREDTGITSGWRLEVTCSQGTGTILPVPLTAERTIYRGEGLFLGWDQARLAEIYKVFTAPDGKIESDLELQQLG